MSSWKMDGNNLRQLTLSVTVKLNANLSLDQA